MTHFVLSVALPFELRPQVGELLFAVRVEQNAMDTEFPITVMSRNGLCHVRVRRIVVSKIYG